MNWNEITEDHQLDLLVQDSYRQPQLIFKHSVRCSISAMVLNRIERQWSISHDKIVPHYLDLLSYRKLSDAVAARFNVTHKSPQILLIINGMSVYDSSHNEISAPDIEPFIKPLENA